MTKTRINIKRSVLISTFAFLLGSSPTAFAQNGKPHYFRMNSGQSAQAKAAGGQLIDHGGPILQNTTTYAIYWGKNAGKTVFPSDLKTAMPTFFEGFGGSVYSYILDQYFPAIFASAFDTTTVSDGSGSPTASPSTKKIVNEVCKYIKSKKLPLDPIDPAANSGGIYFVFTSTFPKKVNFCGWHDYGKCKGQEIAVAYIPNLTNVAGCDPGDLFGANSYSEGTRADVNVVAHEFSEASTDPELSAWFDGAGNEIGDKCAWIFESAVTLANSTTWQLQDEWSNSIAACAQEQVSP